ncbi:glycoside hydrolase family 2 protein [Subtercola endophyticus]|uniref:glycoside hydrolase family 2 protein n=1 Tax=Subtercola endophyticus TaxID=2895559 RepID=UPI001E3B5D72|nr:glycoside hydrolase family 2 TIM barrel-domain containing protein [Subtercola endophyticus]UFS58732.1 hypothetical protein LQ955_17310 [Subtercola endophyticus]
MTETPSRRKELLNRSWKFTYGSPADAVEPAFDDGAWFDVGIPHSFGIPYFMQTEFYVGWGMYRRQLHIGDADLEKRVALEFQGVFQDAEVFVNGVSAARHLGGYTAFEVDVTELLIAGENVIAVRVSNEWNARLAPRAGEHVFNGGIYRDVSLIVSDPVHIAWYGTSITTVSLDSGSARLSIETEIENETAEHFRGVLLGHVSDGDGNVVATVASDCEVGPGCSVKVHQDLALDGVLPWHPDHPYLYQLDQAIEDDDRAVDTAVTEFGVRTIEFTSDRGFFLNGEHVWINGANVHQDHAGWGDAVTHTAMARDVSLIKQAGMNFIRGSHYPHHEHFATECDGQGMLFWSELPFWGIGGANAEGFWNASAYPIVEADREEFEQSCKRALAEMIRVNRNHPSVVVWSTGNEVFFSDDSVIPEAKNLTRELVELAHAIDPSRPAAVGGAQRRDFDALGDLAGYNGDGAALFHNPPWPNIVSEYGSAIESGSGSYSDRYTDGVEVPHEWRSGIVLWCGFHHGSIVPEMGSMGFIDYYRRPLRSWYWYRNEHRAIEPPVWPEPGTAVSIALTTDRGEISTDGTEDCVIGVEFLDRNGIVVTEERSVTIEVVEGGGVFATGPTITLSPSDNGIREGRGAVEFRSYYAGINRLRARVDGLPAAELTVVAHGGEKWSGQARNIATGPPTRIGLRADASSRVLSEKRPVFSSGARSDRPANLVTDASDPRGWISIDALPGSWLRVDLEGVWNIHGIAIDFVGDQHVPYRVETVNVSDDRTVVARSVARQGSVNHILAGEVARSVIVTFPEAATEVAYISIEGS